MDRHSLDPLSLVSGLAFLAFGLLGAFGGLADLDALRVAWPIVLVATGLALVGSAAAGSRSPAPEAGQDPANGRDHADARDLDNSRDPSTLVAGHRDDADDLDEGF